MSLLVPNIQCGYLHADHPVHGHLCWEIHLFTQGSGVFEQDSNGYAIGEYCLFVSAPGNEHGIKVHKALTFFYIQQEDDAQISGVMADLLERQRQQGALRVSPDQVEELERIKRKCIQLSPALRQSGIHHFISWLYELGAVLPENRPGDRIDRAIAFMRQRIERKLSLDQVARAAGMDRYHFSRSFKERMGQPPMSWFMASKVEAGSFLLSSTNLPLAEIAERLGFSDEFHFNKVFRACNGVPPGHWRRMHRAS